MTKIGALILQKRKQLKMTQAQLSEKSEIAQSTLSYVESGESSPIFHIVEKIVTRGFNMSLGDFFSENLIDIDVNQPIFSTVEEHLATYEFEKNNIQDLNSFGDKLKFLRKYHEVTQDELASLLGITGSAYSAYERNLAKPTEKNIYILAKLFDVPLKSLTLDFNELDTSRIINLSNLKKKDFNKILSIVKQIETYSDSDESNSDFINTSNKNYIDLSTLNESNSNLMIFLFKKLKNSPNLTEDDTEALKNLIKGFITHLKKVHSK